MNYRAGGLEGSRARLESVITERKPIVCYHWDNCLGLVFSVVQYAY